MSEFEELVLVPGQEWPLKRYGAMIVESHCENGDWSAFSESGPAKGNIIWETEAVPVAVILPDEIVIKHSEHTRLHREQKAKIQSLEAEVKVLRDAMEEYVGIEQLARERLKETCPLNAEEVLKEADRIRDEREGRGK